jgi:hypothetical protein
LIVTLGTGNVFSQIAVFFSKMAIGVCYYLATGQLR